MQKSDAIIRVSETLNPAIEKHLLKSSKRVLQHDDNYIETYSEFYDELMEEESVLAG
jgi:hypothetical protein